MLLHKYLPKTAKEFTGNYAALQEIKKWLSAWQKGSALIVHGPVGTGKTLAVRLIARENGYEVLETGADEELPSAKKIISSSMQHSFSKRKKIILIDEAEAEPRKFISELVEKSLYPIIMITGDLYERSMADFRRRFDAVKFTKIRYDTIANFLVRVCEAEGIKYESHAINQLAKMANGDIRAALLDISQTKEISMNSILNTGYRDDTDDIFSTIKIIFKSADFGVVSIAKEKCGNPDDALRWVEENVADEYDAIGIARSMDFISKADIMDSRIIRTQSWNLKKYTYIYSFHGIALSKKAPSSAFVRYKFPRYFPRKSTEAIEKFAANVHTSRRKLAREMNFIKIISKNRDVQDEVGLTKEDLALLKGI
ncbi:MAG: AAA family ATPase [Candidatus Aenigmarchaeota archaeon]|nr:AAA family ATPase [Candidatus Aenigmarchaeota archaeon]MDI6722217.1 AAA family ATPase [Candidatus Aenigmarchaeota archaeon]